MERGWDRRTPLLELTRQQLERRVREAFPAAAVLAAAPLPAGLRNSNFRLELAGAPSPAVFRAYTTDPDACCRESAVLVSVPTELPVPHVYYATSSDDPPWALLEWIPGVPADLALASASPDDVLAFAAECGAALARIHELRFGDAGFLGPALAVVAPLPPWSSVLPELAERSSDRLGRALVDRLGGLVRQVGPELDALFSDPVLCHGDFKPWNLLTSEDAPCLAGILDWEFAFAGPGLFDVGTFLRDESQRPPGYAEAFARGYASTGGILPSGWRRLARLLDLINLCQLIAQGDFATIADLRPLIGATVHEEAAPG